MMNNDRCTWITLLEAPQFFFGAEEDENKPGDGSEEKPKLDSESQNESEEEEESDDSDLDDQDLTGLKSAIKAERELKKAAEKKAKAADKRATALQKEKDAKEAEKLSDIEKANKKATEAEAKATKLVEGYVKVNINAAIEKAASNFIDIDDVLSRVDRSLITFEQDEDDPSIVTVDKKSVQAAVKKLATEKPHWIKSGTEDGEPSGGQFGNHKKQKASVEESQLKEFYPSL